MAFQELSSADPDDREACLRTQLHEAKRDARSGQSEREEALWCQVVLLKHKIDTLERSLALRDEMIELQREKLDRLKTAKPLVIGETHKCRYSQCTTLIPLNRMVCCQSHNQKDRWERARTAQAARVAEWGEKP